MPLVLIVDPKLFIEPGTKAFFPLVVVRHSRSGIEAVGQDGRIHGESK
jgi:hypothetical protein